MKSLQEASNILRSVIPKSQDKLELLNGFANICNDIGIVYIRKNEPLEAMSYYTAALKLAPPARGRKPQDPRIVQLKYELANQLNQMGNLHSDIGLFTDASKLHGEVLALLKELVAANPQHELGNDLQCALAGNHESMGDVHNRNDQAAAALKLYMAMLPIRERLAKTNPEVTDYQSDLAHTYFTLGLLQARTGQTAAAVESYQCAIERQRLVVVVAPQVAEYPRLLSREIARFGGATEAGRTGRGLALVPGGCAILEKACSARRRRPL